MQIRREQERKKNWNFFLIIIIHICKTRGPREMDDLASNGTSPGFPMVLCLREQLASAKRDIFPTLLLCSQAPAYKRKDGKRRIQYKVSLVWKGSRSIISIVMHNFFFILFLMPIRLTIALPLILIHIPTKEGNSLDEGESSNFYLTYANEMSWKIRTTLVLKERWIRKK